MDQLTVPTEEGSCLKITCLMNLVLIYLFYLYLDEGPYFVWPLTAPILYCIFGLESQSSLQSCLLVHGDPKGHNWCYNYICTT